MTNKGNVYIEWYHGLQTRVWTFFHVKLGTVLLINWWEVYSEQVAGERDKPTIPWINQKWETIMQQSLLWQSRLSRETIGQVSLLVSQTYWWLNRGKVSDEIVAGLSSHKLTIWFACQKLSFSIPYLTYKYISLPTIFHVSPSLFIVTYPWLCLTNSSLNWVVLKNAQNSSRFMSFVIRSL